MKKSFTLIEIVVVTIIIGILATLGVPTYRNIVDDANARVCVANQDVLARAIDAYALEQDVLPGNLSQLRREDIYRAFASYLQSENGLRLKLAYFIKSFSERGLLYAETEDNWVSRYVQDLTVVVCPARKGKGGRSYGMNARLQGIPLAAYRALPDMVMVIADSSASLIDGLSDLRADGTAHSRTPYVPGAGQNYAVAVCKGHAAFRVYADGSLEHITSSAEPEFTPSHVDALMNY